MTVPREYQATVTVKGWRKHTCEHCGGKFAYPLRRTAAATAGTGWTGSDDRAVREAKKAAKADAEEKLESEIECVPCLHCGQFQSDMVEELRRKHAKGKTLLLTAFGILALVAAGIAALVTMAMLDVKKKPGGEELPYLIIGLAWAVALVFALGAGAMFLMRQTAMKSFDPYGGKSEKHWMKVARDLGAVTPEEYKQIDAARRAANPEFDEPLVAEEGKNPFATGSRKKGTPPASAPTPAPKPTAPPPAAKPAEEKNPFDFS